MKASKSIRFFFLFVSSVGWLSIWLTGFSTVHWVSYLVPSFFLIAAVTGICPGMIITKKLFNEA